MHSSLDSFVYSPILSYINGISDFTGRSVQLYIQLSYPGVVPSERLVDPKLRDAPVIWEPQDHRLGLVYFDAPGVGRKVLRAVHLRSYSFYLAFFDPGAKASVAADFTTEFLARSPGTVLLLASRSRVDLVCDGMDAWRSYAGARENALIAE